MKSMTTTAVLVGLLLVGLNSANGAITIVSAERYVQANRPNSSLMGLDDYKFSLAVGDFVNQVYLPNDPTTGLDPEPFPSPFPVPHAYAQQTSYAGPQPGFFDMVLACAMDVDLLLGNDSEPDGQGWRVDSFFDVFLTLDSQTQFDAIIDMQWAALDLGSGAVLTLSVTKDGNPLAEYEVGYGDSPVFGFESGMLDPGSYRVTASAHGDGGTEGTNAALGSLFFFLSLNEAPPVIPEPSTFLIWSRLGGLGIAAGWWRRRAA